MIILTLHAHVENEIVAMLYSIWHTIDILLPYSLPKKGPCMGGVPYISLKLGGGPTLQASTLSTTKCAK